MSLESIAKLAGVSKATVSRVLNGRPGPSVKTVHKVNRVVEKVGYIPAPLDRRRGMRKSVSQSLHYRQVALIVVDQGYRKHPELFASLVHGIGSSLADQGLTLVLANHPHRLPQVIQRGWIDGMLLSGSQPAPELLEQLPDVPTVWLTSYRHHRYDHVMLGNEAAGSVAAEFLLKNTDGPLAYLNSESTYLALQRRSHAFQSTLQEAGREVVALDLPRHARMQSASNPELSRLLATIPSQLLKRQPKIEGVFCGCDRLTAMLYPHLIAAGIRPMKDLLVVSCDSEEVYLAGLDPRPVTIDLALSVVGQRAVEHLLKRIRQPKQHRAESLVLGAELVLPDGFHTTATRQDTSKVCNIHAV